MYSIQVWKEKQKTKNILTKKKEKKKKIDQNQQV